MRFFNALFICPGDLKNLADELDTKWNSKNGQGPGAEVPFLDPQAVFDLLEDKIQIAEKTYQGQLTKCQEGAESVAAKIQEMIGSVNDILLQTQSHEVSTERGEKGDSNLFAEMKNIGELQSEIRHWKLWQRRFATLREQFDNIRPQQTQKEAL